MQYTIPIGKPIIRETADMVVVQDGERLDSYNRNYYPITIDRSAAAEIVEVPWITAACNGDVSATERWLLPRLTLQDAIDAYASYGRAFAGVAR